VSDAVLIDKLLQSLADDADSEHRLLLAEALIGLQPQDAAWRAAASIIAPAALTAADSASLDARRANVLARLPLRSIRRRLQQIAADRMHPNARHLAVALACVRDDAGLETLQEALAAAPDETLAQAVAMLPLENRDSRALGALRATLMALLTASAPAAEAARPWAAIALARMGDLEPLEQLWDALVRLPSFWATSQRAAAFQAPPAMFLSSSPSALAAQLASVRPLPERVERYLVGLRENDYDERWAPRHDLVTDEPRAATIFYAGLTGRCHLNGQPVEAGLPAGTASPSETVAQVTSLLEELGQGRDLGPLGQVDAARLDRIPDRLAIEVVEITGLKLDPGHAVRAVRGRSSSEYSNAFVNLVSVLPRGVPWRATRMLAGPLADWLPHRALAWTLARAGTDHVLAELVPRIVATHGGNRTRWLGWLATIGNQFDAARPLTGGGDDNAPAAPRMPVLIDDTTKRSRPPVFRGSRGAEVEAAGAEPVASEPGIEGAGTIDGTIDGTLGGTPGGTTSGQSPPKTSVGREVFPDIDASDAHPLAGQTVNFVVSLGAKRSATTSGGARLPDTPPEQVLKIKVHLLFASASAWSELEWSAERNTITPATFALAAPAIEGESALVPVRANFYLERRWCGEGRRLLDVRAAATTRLAQLPLAEEPPWRRELALQPDAVPPDLLVRIQKGATAGDFVWSCLSPHTDFPAPAQPADACMSLKEEAATFVRKTFAPLAGQLLSDLKLADMEGAGEKIYRNTPKYFKDCYWALRHQAESDGFAFESIQIVTDEPCVPWELMRMVDKQRAPGVAPELLSIRHCVGRWLADESAAMRQRIAVSQVAVAASSYDGVAAVGSKLPWAAKEKSLLTGTYHAQDVPLTSTDVRAFLEHGQAQALHVACHGKMSITDPDASVLLMEDTPSDLTPLTVGRSEVCDGLGSQHPLVFLNACEVGATAGSISLVAGFPAAFLYAGAAAVISPLWVVNDERAHHIAEAFYRAVFVPGGGRTLGDVMREVRRSWKDEKHLTFLAYVLYGDPMATIDYKTPGP